MLTRRKLLLATGGIAAGAALIKPSDEGGAHSPYFARLNKTLRNNGIDTPVLVIDLDRLDRNVDRVVQSVGSTPEKNYRVVAKSIPSPQLVDYVAQRANTQSLMVFHRPFLQEMSRLNPQADILMGKPMPVAAAKTFYATPTEAFNPERQLQWLIDTNQRLNQYLQLAQSKEVKMRVNFELDVGLHRGGFEVGSELAQALTTIQNNPDYLKFAGFMGYDAHLMGLPKFLADQELPKVKAKYAACVAQLNDSFPTLVSTDVCFNGAGSPTFRHYEGDTVVNDLSVGSALMKPTHYDLPILEDFEPSAFIASPVLKQLQGSRLPAAEWVGPMLRGWNQNQEHIYFCYSGNWLAENESPPGLTPHFAYVSSNQQGYTGSDSVELEVDDFIFLRPTQSEAVLLQFGDLVVMRGDKIVDRWPVLPVSV